PQPDGVPRGRLTCRKRQAYSRGRRSVGDGGWRGPGIGERSTTVSDSLRNDAGAVTRRSFLVKAGGAGLTIASSGLLAACGGVKKSGGGGSGETPHNSA